MRKIATFLTLLVAVGCAKDLRPQSAHDWKDTPPSDAVAQGRELLAQAAMAHGVDSWAQASEITVELEDTWHVGMFRSMMTPLRERTTHLTYTFKPGSGFTGEGEVLDGKHAGFRFGLDGRPGPDSYVVSEGQRKQKGGLAAQIYAPSVQYFTEFPFRIREADVVGYVDTVDWLGRPHHRVLATWDTAKPHMQADQYLIYIDTETKLINLVRYTVRVAGPPMASAIAFTDVRNIEGMRLPYDLQVGFFNPNGLREIHRAFVQDIEVTFTETRQASANSTGSTW